MTDQHEQPITRVTMTRKMCYPEVEVNNALLGEGVLCSLLGLLALAALRHAPHLHAV